MCGIAGIININGFQSEKIHDFTNIIRHRGPDGEGYLLVDTHNELYCAGGIDTPCTVCKSKIDYSPTNRLEHLHGIPVKLAFGHRRLSILDLSPAGHQPMSYQKKRYWITYNGEIYNYQDLKTELQRIGYQFITRTDAEVVLAAYSEWGADCLNRFSGMWAFAIYDHKLKEIFLARDRYGIKPLYYWFSPDNCFCFASEIKQFTVLKGWQAKINSPRVYDYLTYSFTDHTDETMFKGVYHLPSGSYYRSSINDIRPDATARIISYKWYSFKREPFKGSLYEAAEIFRTLFEHSVKEHLYADVPVGTALSGGLDSSAIVCEINKILVNNGLAKLQKTFSSCAVDERFNEKKWMDVIIEHTHVEPHFIYPGFKDVIELTSDIIWHQDEPYQSQSAFLGYCLFKFVSKTNVRVLLNGQGADEYLGGYGQFTAARYAGMLKRFQIISLLRDLKYSRMINPVSYQRLIKNVLFVLLSQKALRKVSQNRSSADHVKNLLNIDRLAVKPSNPMDNIPIRYKTVPEISKHLTFYSTLPKYLRWEDRNSMAHSIEARVPFLDHRLVEFTHSLPDHFLEMSGTNKRIMRIALNDMLPEKIINRKDKMGFITPEEVWVKRDNPLWFRKKIEEAVEVTDGIIKPEALEYFDNVVNGSVAFDYTYWRLIMFSEWIKVFGVKI